MIWQFELPLHSPPILFIIQWTSQDPITIIYCAEFIYLVVVRCPVAFFLFAGECLSFTDIHYICWQNYEVQSNTWHS